MTGQTKVLSTKMKCICGSCVLPSSFPNSAPASLVEQITSKRVPASCASMRVSADCLIMKQGILCTCSRQVHHGKFLVNVVPIHAHARRPDCSRPQTKGPSIVDHGGDTAEKKEREAQNLSKENMGQMWRVKLMQQSFLRGRINNTPPPGGPSASTSLDCVCGGTSAVHTQTQHTTPRTFSPPAFASRDMMTSSDAWLRHWLRRSYIACPSQAKIETVHSFAFCCIPFCLAFPRPS